MTRIRFEDLPSTNTPRNAENLNKLNNVVISPTEPTTGEEVWIQRGKNLINFQSF
jgi:predicted acylesterase/phospholipase RssA